MALSVLAAMGSLRQMVAAGQQIANSARGTVFASSRNVPRTRKEDLVPLLFLLSLASWLELEVFQYFTVTGKSTGSKIMVPLSHEIHFPCLVDARVRFLFIFAAEPPSKII